MTPPVEIFLVQARDGRFFARLKWSIEIEQTPRNPQKVLYTRLWHTRRAVLEDASEIITNPQLGLTSRMRTC